MDGSILLDFPPLEDLSMTITNSCATGGEVPHTKNNQNTYIVTHPEIEFTYRPQMSKQLPPLIKQYSNIVLRTS